MRALPILLASFGFLFGFLIIAVSVLIEWASLPTRTDFAFVDDGTVAIDSTPSIGASYEAIYTAVATPFAGAVLGWLLALIMTRLGWRFSRQIAPPATE